jgi:hypothetical protein
MIGVLALVPGLLLRNEYRASIFPRLLVTIGALCVLAMYLLPVDGEILIANLFDGLAEAPGKAKVKPILLLLPIVYAAISLLAWLPAPSRGLGKVTAWLWITLAPLMQVVLLLVGGHIGDVVTASPYAALMVWVAGGLLAYGSAYLVLFGYGLATVIGKKLE